MTDNFMYGKEVADKISQGAQESGMPEVLYCCPKKQGYNGHRVEHSLPGDMPYIRVDIHIKLQAENERLHKLIWHGIEIQEAYYGDATTTHMALSNWAKETKQALKGNADDDG